MTKAKDLQLVFNVLFLLSWSLMVAQQMPKVEIEEIIRDSTLNVRALEVLQGSSDCAFVTSNGHLGGIIDLSGKDAKSNYLINYPITVSDDSLKLNFRSLAANQKTGFAMTIGNPALLYELDADSSLLVYREDHEKVFYDSMEFWNEEEGMAIGDPTDDCMSIIITRDAGETWNKLDCALLPKALEGEAAFAASDTNIAIVGDHAWVATGGKRSRILYTPDKGKNWQVFNSPIIQGKETTGIYSIDFYDEFNGFGIGGDYTDPDDNSANKIRTSDGGKTWKLVKDGPGYRSCVQYVPGSEGRELVVVGFKGVDYSIDSGQTWEHLSDESFYTIRFINKTTAFAAGKGRVAKLTFE
ncbi:MAG: oxidoreductase [Bacteroidia bacterium]|nr:oxidoreductase [Bacteroidia bacterium]MBT8268304.1 oxidoreductase [Bacteroidia bacterium]NNF81514.1 oxidoreductase [Flavobacteriaceae bacterium]NNK70185.1 oxidoreductase [Flavobacteriaceae bacterium]NNL81205.1 oxidoreductase [Flavobacteriaceae bacterium]